MFTQGIKRRFLTYKVYNNMVNIGWQKFQIVAQNLEELLLQHNRLEKRLKKRL